MSGRPLRPLNRRSWQCESRTEYPIAKILQFPEVPLRKATTAAPAELSRAKILAFRANALSMPGPDARHPVYMSILFGDGHWQCEFFEGDRCTSLSKDVTLASTEALVHLVGRGAGLESLESRQALDRAIATGRGGVFLSLTPKQYLGLHIYRRT
jgi:hypothetical protein